MAKLYNAENVLEAEEIIALLKENDIPAYYQNSASGVIAHEVSGFSLYGVDVFVNDEDLEKAQMVRAKVNDL